jgi:DNA-binding CsgD family transcriptional regulator
VGRLEKQIDDAVRSRLEHVPSGVAEHLASEELNQLFENLADVAKSVGTSEFYSRAANCVAQTLNSDRYLAIRYAKFSRPEFLVNTAMTSEATEDYLASYYRIDPLLRMVRDGVAQNVLTFDELRRSGADTLFYEEMYRTAEILDELVMLLPTVGGIWTAICVDRSELLFDRSEIKTARFLFPLLNNLHALHVERCVFGWRGGYLDDSHIAFMMIDTEGNIAFRNTLWGQQVDAKREEQIRAVSGLKTDGFEPLSDGMVVHWETLDLQNSVAPGGKAYFIEEPSPGYVDLSEGGLVERFSTTYRLTPREKEIVELILQGHPPALIADTMGLSVGTIRNHKHRLYYKLDITTERELFCMFFEQIIAGR